MSSDSTAVPPAAPVRRSFRQKLVRKSWAALQDGSAAALGQGARRAGGDRPARHRASCTGWPAADPARALGAGAPGAAAAAGLGLPRPGAGDPDRPRPRLGRRPAPLFAAPAAARAPGAAAGAPARPPGPGGRARPARAASGPADLDPATAAALVVYTTAFGDEPDPAPVFAPLPGLRFVCLTDRPLGRGRLGGAAAGRGRARSDADPRRPPPGAASAPTSRWPRRRPAAAASLYLAPDRWLVGNLDTLLLRWCLPHDLALWRHPRRASTGRTWPSARWSRGPGGGGGHRPGRGLRRARGLPRDRGAWDTGMIWRRHHAPEVAALMAAWWAEAEAAPAARGRSALYAALNGPGGAPRRAPRLLPAALGAADDNAFVGRPPAGAAPRARERRPGRGAWPVAVVYAEKYAASASTFLRGRQLAEMVAARDPDLADTLYTSDLAGLRDRVVVLTKGALEVHSGRGDRRSRAGATSP